MTHPNIEIAVKRLCEETEEDPEVIGKMIQFSFDAQDSLTDIALEAVKEGDMLMIANVGSFLQSHDSDVWNVLMGLYTAFVLETGRDPEKMTETVNEQFDTFASAFHDRMIARGWDEEDVELTDGDETDGE